MNMRFKYWTWIYLIWNTIGRSMMLVHKNCRIHRLCRTTYEHLSRGKIIILISTMHSYTVVCYTVMMNTSIRYHRASFQTFLLLLFSWQLTLKILAVWSNSDRELLAKSCTVHYLSLLFRGQCRRKRLKSSSIISD